MNKKKLLALLMALVMTLTLVPVTAFAEGDDSNEYFGTASVYDGDTLVANYNSLGEAINAATTGQKIILSEGQFEISGSPAEGVTISGQGPEKTTIYTSASGNDITNKNVTIENVKIDGEAASEVYYAGAINLRGDGATINNCVISGGGTKTWGASVAIFMNPGEKAVIRNSQISGAFRAVFLGSTSGGVDIDNCVIQPGAYCINVDGEKKQGFKVVLNVSNSTLRGWTSYGDAVTEATFTNVTFEEGEYDYLYPYSNTTLVGCTFDSKFELGVRDGLTHTLKDCRVREDNGSYSAITAENYARIIDATENNGTIIVIEPAAVAKIGDTPYASLEEAFANAEDGQTITLLADCAGNGIKAPQGKFNTNGLTVDFGGHTYTVDGETVGSTGTETNGFQLLKDNTITFKNGTITSTKAKILVQNYSDLTLDGMTLTLDNSSYTSAYTLSNNNGNVVIDGSTITANPAGGYAFDVCRFSSYPSVNVTVTGNSAINGDVEISASGSDAKDGFGLTLTSGTLNGNIVMDSSAATAMAAAPEKVSITKEAAFDAAAPTGYKWNDNGNLVKVTYVAKIDNVKYETLEEAFAAAVDGDTITVLANCSGNGIKAPQGKFSTGLTVDFGYYTYTMDGTEVGSAGTETQAFQLLKDNKITFKNGTLYSEKAKFLVQNYSDLTLEGMTLTLNNPNYAYGYTLSNNNGNVVIDDTTINANPAGRFAFDVCRYSSYPSVNVEVKGDSVINGDVEISASKSDAKDGFSLTLTSGTMSGNIVMDSSAATAMAAAPEKVSITKASGFDKAAPEGYKWSETETAGVYKLVEKDYVAQIGDVKYETLQAAINAVPTNGTPTIVKVLAEETDLGGATIDGNRNVVLDLDEKTVYAYAHLKEGKLTVQNGCLCGYTQSINVYGSADSTKAAGEYNELTIASSAIIGNGGDYYGIILRDVQKDNAGDSKYAYGSKINVDGKILDNIWVMGNIKEGNSVINIKDGAEVTATDTAIALQGKATVNVKGGAITGRTGIENRGGTLNVTGGTITGNGEMIQVKPNGSGVTTHGAGVVVSQHTTRQDITVNVTGGTITGKVALLAVNPEGNPTGEGTLTVNVTGGTFTGGESAVAVLNADERVQVSLKGGTYSSNPSAVGNDFTYYLYGKDDTVTANVQGSGVATTVQTTDCVATGYMADSQSENVWIIKVKEGKFVDVKDENNDAVLNQEVGSNTSFSFATATSETDVTYAIKTTTIAGEVQTDSYKPVETEVVTKSSVGTVVVDNGVTNGASTAAIEAIENSIKETATSMTSTITAKKGSETATTDILKTIAAANAITKAAAAYEAGDGHMTSDIAKVEVQLETTLTGYTLANSGASDVTASKVVFSVVPKAVLLDVEGNQLGNAVELDNDDLAKQALKITFTLPIPDKLVDTGTMKVKVTHRSSGVTYDVNDYTVQGNAGSYFVEITAEHFSDFEVEKISETETNLNDVNYVSSYSLTCTDKIGVNFYFHLTQAVLDDPTSYIEVSFDGQYESGAKILVSSVTADKDEEYKFSYYVAPAESTKDITLTLHTNSGTVDIYNRDGSKTDGGTFTKSMKDVAEIYLSSTTASAKMKTLASRLIAYCVYTELYFKKTTYHDYSNVVLGNIEAARAGLAEYALENLAGGSIGYDGMSLLLDKETSIKLYTTDPSQTLTYSFNGGASTELNPYASGGEYAVKISNLPGAYLDRMYSITVGTNEVLRVSALSWANSMINKNDPYKQNIAAAMYYYNVAANEYFGQKGV